MYIYIYMQGNLVPESFSLSSQFEVRRNIELLLGCIFGVFMPEMESSLHSISCAYTVQGG